MKRFAIVLLTILLSAPIALGLMAGFAYFATGEASVPAPAITAMGTSLAPRAFEWQEPVMAGILYRDFTRQAPDDACTDLGEVTTTALTLDVPEEYAAGARAEVLYGGTRVWEGRAQDIGQLALLENGSYRLKVTCEKAPEPERGHGVFHYEASFSVLVEPVLEVNAERLEQGDVFAICISDLAAGITPTVDGELGTARFTRAGTSRSVAYLPIPHNCRAGTYEMTVQAGQYSWALLLRVSAAKFEQVYLDTRTLPGSDSTANSAEAQTAFKEAMDPLYETADEERYWQGAFAAPVDGEIEVPYGQAVYPDGVRTPTVHTGVDIAAAAGSAVTAPANGRVVYAGELEHTGGTIVIEHGGGLKTYYYHLRLVNVRQGDYVFTGNYIGLVGDTGYAEQPHLHFEARIGSESISAGLLLNGTSGLYAFETIEAEK
ncbi:MAG: M23 family metallopeptidase [Oscillospiraceae bacterium]